MSQATARILEEKDEVVELGFEELDEPVFIPMEIVPDGHHVDGHTQAESSDDGAE